MHLIQYYRGSSPHLTFALPSVSSFSAIAHENSHTMPSNIIVVLILLIISCKVVGLLHSTERRNSCNNSTSERS